MPLTEDGIHTVALRLIDTDGVEALTMRKLAAELDANPMSLYHHVPNKDALLQGVVQRVSAQFRTPEQAEFPWQDRLRQLALDFRALAHRHPKLMEYSIRRADFLQPEDPFWRGLTEILAAAKLPTSEISRVAATVCAVFTGLLLNELTGALQRWATFPPSHIDADVSPVDAMFTCALDAAIASIENQAGS